MKQCKFLMLLLFIGSAGLSGCDNNNDPIDKVEKTMLEITTSWADGSVTRSLKSDFEAGDRLGLYITSGDLDNIYNLKQEYSNVISDWSGQHWLQQVNIYLDNKEATIYAYYPHSAQAGNGKAVLLETASQTDYMYGVGSTKATIATPSTNIEMKHALTQVAFRITTKNYSGNGLLQEVKVSNEGPGGTIFVKGFMDCQTGQVTGTEAGTLTLSADKALSETESVFSAITMPVPVPTTDKTIRLTFKIDDVNYVYSLSPGTVWAPGTKNIYTICLEGKNIEIGGDENYGQDGVDIKDWSSVINGEIKLTPIN